MEKMLVIDGNSIINRAFYGVRMLTNSKGMFTNALYGFLNILYKYLDSENPDYICVAFDVKHPTFRHEKFPEYKAGRHGMPEELKMQMPVLKELLTAMNIKIVELPGFEADDILGTVSKMCSEKGIICNVVTGDRDALQLASDTTKIFLTSTKGGNTVTDIIDRNEIISRFGVTPDLIIDAKGLMGDTSDNIPGVSGVGEKTAYGLVRDYGTLENIYKNIESIKGKLREKLESDRDNAFLSRELATIFKDVPMGLTLEDFKIGEINTEKYIEMLTELEFSALIKKIGKTSEIKHESLVPVLITTLKEAEATAEKITKAQINVIYIHKVGAEPVGVAVSDGEKSYYFDLTGGLLSEISLTDLKPIFESNIPKIMHYSKDEKVYLQKLGINLNEVCFDTAVAGYILEPSRSKYDIDMLLGITLPQEFYAKGKKSSTLFDVENNKMAEISAVILGGMISLSENQKVELKKRQQEELFYDIELPLSDTLADMEIEGFKVDKQSLSQFSNNLDTRLNELTSIIYEIAGCEFNINSPKQLGEVLFDKLRLPTVKKNKTGYSTNSEVLDKLEPENPIITYIKEYRILAKLKSTYCEGLLQVIDDKDGKIHSKFMQTVTVTGRISSTEPNLQNIPVKLKLGREIRKMFVVSGEDRVLVDADYSQIELRVLAHIANDKTMIDAFKNNEDIHKITASQVFGVAPDEVTPEMRSNAKAVNFGIVYGISDFALGVDLGITKKQARSYIDGYLSKYENVRKYMSDIVEKATNDGYVTTLHGRRRYIPELRSTKFLERSFGQRVALNTPIQGTAADIIKIAMVRVSKRLREEGLKSKLILQVHDELIIEAYLDEEEKVRGLLNYEMENAAKLSVPLVANIETGKSWYDCK